VYNIQEVAAEVQALAPSARVVYGHGQMAPKELEAVMLKFMRRQADILVSTTIIESGIDNPTANTMIIADADRFGLSELHQLRGRVGRYKNRAYCYLLLPDDRPIKEKAKKRLAAIEQFSMLGAGFKIAMRDLEIRGAGNILGPEQSGHIAAVGYDMYCQLLERSVRQLKNEVVATPSEVSLDIGVTGLIPKGYIPSEARRLEAYRRIAVAPDAKTLDQIRADIISAYGSVPEACERLLDLALVRAGARSGGVRSILIKERDLVIRTTDQASVVGRMIGAPGRSTVLPPRNPGEVPEVYWRPEDAATLEPRRLLGILKRQFGAAAAFGSGTNGVAGAVVKPAGSAMIAPAAPLPPKGPSIKKPLFSPARIVPVNRTASGSSPAAGKKPGKVPLSRELRDVKKMLRQAAKESPQFKAMDSGGEASDDDL